MSSSVRTAVIAFVVVGVVSLVPAFGLFCVGPLAAVVVGGIAGYRAASTAEVSPSGAGIRAGLAAGVGALIGALVVGTLTGLVVGSLPGVQDIVRQSGAEADAGVATEWIAPIASALGALVGVILGVMDFLAAVVAGLVGAAIGGQRPPATGSAVE
jgi:hypothetical protein